MKIDVETSPRRVDTPPPAPQSPDPDEDEPATHEPVDEPVGGSLAKKLAALEAAEHEQTGEGSDDYAQAMKRFRRRA